MRYCFIYFHISDLLTNKINSELMGYNRRQSLEKKGGFCETDYPN